MKIYLAADHAGFSIKEKVKISLEEKEYDVEDCGAYEFNKDDDYPDFIRLAAENVSKNPQNAKGIIFGGSGQAEAIVANKFKNVRCAIFYSPALPVVAADVTGRMSTDPYEMIRLTREHNDTNMLSMGARFLKADEAIKVVNLWLQAPFEQAERHVRRIEKIQKIEDGL